MNLSQLLQEDAAVSVAVYPEGTGFTGTPLHTFAVPAAEVRVTQDPDGGNYQLEMRTDAGSLVGYPHNDTQPWASEIGEVVAFTQGEFAAQVRASFAQGLPLVAEVY